MTEGDIEACDAQDFYGILNVPRTVSFAVFDWICSLSWQLQLIDNARFFTTIRIWAKISTIYKEIC